MDLAGQRWPEVDGVAMLTFLGTGSAFNAMSGNNSAYVRQNDGMLLVDCGGVVFERLMKDALLNALGELHIVLTHTHPDHVGSLGDLIFYAHYILGIVPVLLFPDEARIRTLLDLQGVDPLMYKLESALTHVDDSARIGRYSLEFIPVPHVRTMPSWGFELMMEDVRLFYSGDASELPAQELERLKSGALDLIYQDTCGQEYEGNVHTPLIRLEQQVPREWRSRVVCMHHDKQLDLEKVRVAGFQIPQPQPDP